MNLYVNQGIVYYLHNQGNNNRTIFKSADDYIKFLLLFRKFVLPHCDVIAWCLIPNQFHFQIRCNQLGSELIQVGGLVLSRFGNGVRLLQTNYAQYYNRKYKKSGSLFKQKSKIERCENEYCENYNIVVFQHIQTLAINKNLVQYLLDWPFSSFPDYSGNRNGSLINREIASQILGDQINNLVCF